jgi:hypothetical protein
LQAFSGTLERSGRVASSRSAAHRHVRRPRLPGCCRNCPQRCPVEASTRASATEHPCSYAETQRPDRLGRIVRGERAARKPSFPHQDPMRYSMTSLPYPLAMGTEQQSHARPSFLVRVRIAQRRHRPRHTFGSQPITRHVAGPGLRYRVPRSVGRSDARTSPDSCRSRPTAAIVQVRPRTCGKHG